MLSYLSREKNIRRILRFFKIVWFLLNLFGLLRVGLAELVGFSLCPPAAPVGLSLRNGFFPSSFFTFLNLFWRS